MAKIVVDVVAGLKVQFVHFKPEPTLDVDLVERNVGCPALASVVAQARPSVFTPQRMHAGTWRIELFAAT